MKSTIIRSTSAVLLVLSLAACSSSAQAPAPTAPSTDVNPITGSRGGGGAK